MTMKLAKYKDVLAQSKEKTEEAKAPFRVKEMHKRAELEALEIEAEMASQETRIHHRCSQYPVDYENLVEDLDRLELLKRKHKQLNDIIHQMFDAVALPPPPVAATGSAPKAA